jgi:membrane peptidoglycan carboxypeptidase
MFKILVLIIAAVSIFFWYPASSDPIQKDVAKPAPQHTVQQPSEHSQATVFLLSLLPPKQEWPDPVQKIWLSLNIEEAVQERTNDIDWVPITEIPIEMQQALLAIEDHNFYSHGAIDIDGILRAALVNITAGEVVQGGSTITQQLTKNLFLSQEQTLSRKAEEALLALVMEQHYSKDQLLEIYFNTTYFGAGATGLKAAALTYFAKQPQELQLAECAVIASLPYAPSALNPLENPEGCKKRQLLVLQTMVKRGYIGTTLAEKAASAPVYLANGTTF